MQLEYQPAEDEYPAVWARVFLSGHAGHGGWWRDQQDRPVCACGEPV